ncbi:hypothetical protein ASF21_10795 [Arthrobacter sp. Leaf234]|uniref:hypothetical protein n=1 Tax=Arthrobacter sp. Leaf234 TaxID=1736303 RepID=UPI0006FF90D2|nr:hypothetical protein [Arthrobacter sp. Leaf234]KQO00799.1 hypothetical protein ASF21_10795 [Arthrobacter sp. Leaf234]
MRKYTPEEQRLHTLHAVEQLDLGVHQVWIRYFSIGGVADEFDVDAYLHGLKTLTTLDRDLVAHAVSELIKETPPPPTAPYSDT